MNILVINIDSNHRNYVTHPNAGCFSVQLGEKIRHIKSIKLDSFEFPSKKYFPELYKNINGLIYKNNNYFKVNGTTIEIKANNYNIDSLLVEINNEFTSKLVNCKIEIIQNSQIRIYSTIAPTLLPDVDFNNNNNNIDLSLGKILGFKYDKYKSTTISITSENNFNLQSNEYYFLNINNLGSVYSIDNNYKINNTRYLAKIGISTEACLINYMSPISIFKEPYDISILHISLYDSNNNIVDFKNINYSFTLVITI